MKCGIVRGIWGDVLHQRHTKGKPPIGHYGILLEVKESAMLHEQTDMVYCWGTDNYRFAQYYRLPARLMSDDPYGMPRLQEKRSPKYHGMIMWGMNHFYTKWLLLEAALEDFDVVVNVDWDLVQYRHIHPMFWHQQLEKAKDAKFRAVLGVQPNWSWGAYWRKFPKRRIADEAGHYGAQYVPYFGCMWVRDREFVTQAKELHERYPKLMTQQVAAKVLDELTGRTWIGVDRYEQQGYAADFLELTHALKPIPGRIKTVMWGNGHKRGLKRQLRWMR